MSGYLASVGVCTCVQVWVDVWLIGICEHLE